MGFFDKLAGRPKEARKTSHTREDRHNERASMRASRDSSNWQMTSPSGSTTGGYGHHGAGSQAYMQAGSRRLSSPSSRRQSFGHAQSPAMSPRPHGSVTPVGPAPSVSARHPEIQPTHSVPLPQQTSEQVRELQHKVHSMEAQIAENEHLKQRVLAEQRAATEWREKWNYQNFKLNLMVDMLVLQTLEADGTGGIPAARAAAGGGAVTKVVPAAGTRSGGAGALAGVGRHASSRREQDMVEEDYDD